ACFATRGALQLPHERGSDTRKQVTRLAALEAPRRAWGRLVAGNPRSSRCGNTPTCVGKTDAPAGVYPLQEKHPHVRGEDHPEQEHPPAHPETPPRAWGRPQQIVKEPYY